MNDCIRISKGVKIVLAHTEELVIELVLTKELGNGLVLTKELVIDCTSTYQRVSD